MTARTLWSWIQQILLVVGIACLGYVGLIWIDTRVEQARENRELDRILQSRATTPAAVPMPALPVRRGPATRTVLGRLEIPRLGVSATVREGDDARTLRQAIGHIPGTALPGEAGNAGLAAHRDTFFRRLKDIRKRDEITFTSPGGSHRYVVQETRVVDPRNVEVLNGTTAATLTLVTCYPFNYIGSAPRRFIVRAVRRDQARPTEVAATSAHVAPPPAESATQPSLRFGAASAPDTMKVAHRASKGKAKSRVTRASARPRPGQPAKGNVFGRFFKAAAQGLGFAPRDSRASTRSESRDPRSQRR